MRYPAQLPHPRLTPLLYACTAGVGIALVGWIDIATGIEYRVHGLYFLPLSLAAWELGLAGAVAFAVACTASWFVCNYFGGLDYSTPWVWVSNTAMQGASFALVGVLISYLRRALQRAEALSRIDATTSLQNSRAFSEDARIVLALAARYSHPVTLAYLDLDDFKQVNDTMGHQAGDDLLREVGRLLRGAIRAGDLAARVGGDEFVVLLPETDADGAQRLLDRLAAKLTEPVEGRPPITVSIGAVCSAGSSMSLPDLIRQADTVMYAAKAEGKRRVRVEFARVDAMRREAQVH